MSKKYEQWFDGDWCEVYMRNQMIACCDCHLVHIHDFRIVKKGKRQIIEMRIRRAQRATAALRRPFKFAKDDE